MVSSVHAVDHWHNSINTRLVNDIWVKVPLRTKISINLKKKKMDLKTAPPMPQNNPVIVQTDKQTIYIHLKL